MPGEGPPMPRTGPASPGCAWMSGAVGMPRPAALPIPGPARAEAVDAFARDSSGGGGPSTVMDTTSSPRSRTRPRVRRSSRSSGGPPPGFLDPLAGGSLRNSSQSPRTRFMWRSKAMNLPTSIRPSWMVTRIRRIGRTPSRERSVVSRSEPLRRTSLRSPSILVKSLWSPPVRKPRPKPHSFRLSPIRNHPRRRTRALRLSLSLSVPPVRNPEGRGQSRSSFFQFAHPKRTSAEVPSSSSLLPAPVAPSSRLSPPLCKLSLFSTPCLHRMCFEELFSMSLRDKDNGFDKSIGLVLHCPSLEFATKIFLLINHDLSGLMNKEMKLRGLFSIVGLQLSHIDL
ncbi:hypothetical protein M5K25_014718 [Dendrobium thyrsiflorum]|uniref:Uncharacterized protein n=1 Tax=Dendrobium thyrsiflorum TaxID=117978 RepID=A0ABD0UNG4_DENTH